MGEQRPAARCIAELEARHRFGIGVSLLAVIPLLALGWVAVRGIMELAPPSGAAGAGVLASCLVLAVVGYAILRRYPVNIGRLRRYTEELAGRKVPGDVELLGGEEDLTAIRSHMNTIVGHLAGKLEATEIERDMLREQLFQARKMESLGLMARGLAEAFQDGFDEMRSRIDMALAEMDDDSAAAEQVREIDHALKRARVMLDQIQTYAGQPAPLQRRVDLVGVVGEIKRLRSFLLPKEMDVRYELPAELPPVAGDPVKLQQAISNLLVNAAEAMGRRGVATLSVGVDTLAETELTDAYPAENVRSGRYAFVRVTDSGPGLDLEARSRILDPFFTTREAGRGTGLAVVLGIMRQHGGMVRVRSRPGKGSRFDLLFPLAGGS